MTEPDAKFMNEVEPTEVRRLGLSPEEESFEADGNDEDSDLEDEDEDDEFEDDEDEDEDEDEDGVEAEVI
jgi:hypothetical protein